MMTACCILDIAACSLRMVIVPVASHTTYVVYPCALAANAVNSTPTSDARPAMISLPRPVCSIAAGTSADCNELMLERVSINILGPIPIATLSAHARLVRPGRNVELLEASLEHRVLSS